MAQYIIREEVNPDFEHFFDCDCFSKAAGDFCYTVFALTYNYYNRENYHSDINSKELESINTELSYILEDLDSIGFYYNSIKEIMIDHGMPYSPKKAHALKELANIDSTAEQLCAYLSLKTGRKWRSHTARGYCQGDYADIVFCSDFYDEKSVDIIGDMYLGCAKEFSITGIDDAGAVYGFFVADCEACTDYDYKKIVCEQADIDPAEATLEMIDTLQTVTIPQYRTV